MAWVPDGWMDCQGAQPGWDACRGWMAWFPAAPDGWHCPLPVTGAIQAAAARVYSNPDATPAAADAYW